jgi:hypothetical protein
MRNLSGWFICRMFYGHQKVTDDEHRSRTGHKKGYRGAKPKPDKSGARACEHGKNALETRVKAYRYRRVRLTAILAIHAFSIPSVAAAHCNFQLRARACLSCQRVFRN